MPPDLDRLEQTRAWLAKARADLAAAEVDFRNGPPLLEDALFHCQQAVEKCLKALIFWKEMPFRKTHDLIELGNQCIALAPSLEPLLSKAAVLTEFAWRYRYPALESQPVTADEVQDALQIARSVMLAVLDQLPADVRTE